MFKRVKKNWNMLWPLLALTVVAVIIFLERMGVAENFLKGDQEIAQNERTLFSFLGKNDENSLKYFVQKVCIQTGKQFC